MKKFLIIWVAVSLLFLFGGSASADSLWIVKIGANTNGYLNFIPDSSPPVSPTSLPVYGGCVISFEQLFELSEHLELGYGAEIQFAGSLNINDYFRGIPVFLSLNYHPNDVDDGGLYLLGRIGFNFYGYYGYNYYYNYYSLQDPMINGFYYALGAGYRLSKYPVIRLEGFFTGNNGSAYYYNSTSDYVAYSKYTKFTIAIGFGMGD